MLCDLRTYNATRVSRFLYGERGTFEESSPV